MFLPLVATRLRTTWDTLLWIWTMSKTNKTEYVRDYARAFFSESVVSLFWAVINDRRRTAKLPLQAIADATGIDKAKISRDFNGSPNWRTSTMVDIGNALGVDLEIRARDRATGVVFTPAGPIVAAQEVRTGMEPAPKPDSGEPLYEHRERLPGGPSVEFRVAVG